MPQISACIKEKEIRAWLAYSLVPASWHRSGGLPVTRGTSLCGLAGDWISEGTAEVAVAGGKRETRPHKSEGNRLVYFCCLCKVFGFL